jgi:hypothetical protein
VNRGLRSLALLLFFAVAARAQAPLRIGKITIEPLDVYSDAEARRGAVYRLADRLHIETRRPVIEQFLLFHEGDPYRPERLRESERNLRALGFLKSASVTESAPHDGVVDVTVTTQDSWSIAPETQAGSRGGMHTYGATISETNLLGFGKDLELGFDKGVDRRRFLMSYDDPAFFAPYWRAHFGYAYNSDGYAHQFNLRRPFYSFATPWATDFGLETLRQTDRLYRAGAEVARFSRNHRDLIAGYGMALDPNDDHANRLTAGLRFIDDDFAPLAHHSADGLPASREYRYLFVRFAHAENDFLKLNFVNKDLRYEDFNLGRQFSLEAALSPAALGVASTSEFFRVTASAGARLGDDGFVLPTIAFSSRVASGGMQNAIGSANLFYVRRSEGRYQRTLVGRAAVNSGWRLDPELQFFADGLTGLRGYRAHMFEGTRSLVVNLEERIYLGREIGQLASPGIVAFIDGGNASRGGLSSLLQLKTDIGIGLRVGLPRTPKNLLRIDLAYAVNRDPRGRRGFLVSFSSGQAF